MIQFKTVGLVGRLGSDSAVETIQRLIHFLEAVECKVVLDVDTAAVMPDCGLPKVNRDYIGEHSDLVIVVGGDGSLLGAARAVCEYGKPLLGVNRGRLGFLTDISPEEIETKVAEVLQGRYRGEQRFLLQMAVMRDGEQVGAGDALNDVVIHPGKFIRMIEFEVYVDNQFAYSQRSDGLIISTPTGSTAYALSGGGPLMHPTLEAIELVPINPHTLSSRPMIVSSSSEIRLLVGMQNTAFPHVTCDGQTHVVTQPGDEIVVTQKPQRLTLIHPEDHDFYETCRTKLGWGSHLVD